MTSTIQTTIPGFVAGTWTINPVHTDLSSTAKHMMVSKVRGHFRTFSGTLVTSEDITQSSVIAEIDLASFCTSRDRSRAGSASQLSNRPVRRLMRMPFEGRWTHTLGTAAPRLGAPSVG
ncbi:MAG: YceI family protein [Geodermatophilaceae bacterium]|nr:YceI family protein [Geodermatophilaceae bacterium]